jgi:hypothetical protein
MNGAEQHLYGPTCKKETEELFENCHDLHEKFESSQFEDFVLDCQSYIVALYP